MSRLSKIYLVTSKWPDLRPNVFLMSLLVQQVTGIKLRDPNLWFHSYLGEFTPVLLTLQCANQSLRTLLQAVADAIGPGGPAVVQF